MTVAAALQERSWMKQRFSVAGWWQAGFVVAVSVGFAVLMAVGTRRLWYVRYRDGPLRARCVGPVLRDEAEAPAGLGSTSMAVAVGAIGAFGLGLVCWWLGRSIRTIGVLTVGFVCFTTLCATLWQRPSRPIRIV